MQPHILTNNEYILLDNSRRISTDLTFCEEKKMSYDVWSFRRCAPIVRIFELALQNVANARTVSSFENQRPWSKMARWKFLQRRLPYKVPKSVTHHKCPRLLLPQTQFSASNCSDIEIRFYSDYRPSMFAVPLLAIQDRFHLVFVAPTIPVNMYESNRKCILFIKKKKSAQKPTKKWTENIANKYFSCTRWIALNSNQV